VWKELNYGQMREKEKQLVVSEVSSAPRHSARPQPRASNRLRAAVLPRVAGS
jgi:hypothetical protein